MNARDSKRIQVDEVAILLELKAGRERAFDYLFDTFYGPLFNFISHILKDQGAAEDILADTFISFWQRVEHYNFSSITQVKAMLYSVARNGCLNALKKRKHARTYEREASFLFQQGDPNFHDEVGMEGKERVVKEIVKVINQVIRDMPPKCRQVMVLHCIEQLSLPEIAAKLSLSLNTTTQRKDYGMRILRRRINRRSYRNIFYKQ